MSRGWALVRGYGFDVLIAIAAVEGALEVALREDAGQELATSRWFAAPATACVVLPLLARRRWPFAAPVVMWGLAAALSFVEGWLVVSIPTLYIAGLVASLLLGAVRDVVRARAGLAVALGAAAVVVANDPGHTAGEFAVIPGTMAIAWFAGLVLRERAGQAEAAQERATRAEREREENARRAVFEERVRIARELHDVVAHHVSMMGVQAGAARMVIDRDPAKARDALTAIEGSSRQAVDELHRLLGFLRQAGDPDDLAPSPGVSQLPGLAAGMSDSDLTVEVGGSGLGLIGMRERAALHGGQLTAGPVPGGGFAVRVTLPTADGAR